MASRIQCSSWQVCARCQDTMWNAQAAKELGLVLTPPEVFLPAMARCMYQLGHAQPRDKAANGVATNGHVA